MFFGAVGCRSPRVFAPRSEVRQRAALVQAPHLPDQLSFPPLGSGLVGVETVNLVGNELARRFDLANDVALVGIHLNRSVCQSRFLHMVKDAAVLAFSDIERRTIRPRQNVDIGHLGRRFQKALKSGVRSLELQAHAFFPWVLVGRRQRFKASASAARESALRCAWKSLRSACILRQTSAKSRSIEPSSRSC